MFNSDFGLKEAAYHIVAGGGLVLLGYTLGKHAARGGNVTKTKKPEVKAMVAKSYYMKDNIAEYCLEHSTPMHPVQKKLIQV